MAVSEGNPLPLEMLLEIDFAMDGAGYSIAITTEHFILAAQRRETVSISIILMTGQGVISVDHKDVIIWASRVHEEPNDLGIHARPRLLIN